MAKKLKHYYFLFRWFLIGKYHCEVSKTAKKYFKITNFILWFIILFSVLFTYFKLVLD